MVDEREFDQAVDEWVRHCEDPHVQASSDPSTALNCAAYRRIVAMGHETLPFIRKLYDRSNPDDLGLDTIQYHGLATLVREIAGESFTIPIDIRG